MILISDIAIENLEVLADWYFEQLNPKNNDGTYGHWSLIKRIERTLEETILTSEKEFWSKILDEENNHAFLRQMIVGKPEVLESISIEIDETFGKSFISDKSDYYYAKLTEFGSKIKEVFNYETLFRDKAYCNQIISKLGIGMCLYCNETKAKVQILTDTLTQEEKQIRMLDLDHFFPKVRYPYLSISFFNILPSCHHCNSTFKKMKDFKLTTHIHPYLTRFDDQFEFSLNNDIVDSANEIEILILPKGKFASNSEKDLHLKDRYNDDLVKDLFYNFYNEIRNHSTGVLNEINDILVLSGEQPANILSVLRASSVPFIQKDINKYAYGKLKRDTCLKLKLLK